MTRVWRMVRWSMRVLRGLLARRKKASGFCAGAGRKGGFRQDRTGQDSEGWGGGKEEENKMTTVSIG